VPEVRVIDPSGEQLGIMPTTVAIKLAKNADMDLIEISPKAQPPVTRIMNYGKYKYQKAQKEKQQKKSNDKNVIKEIRFRTKIDPNDYNTKMKQLEKFLESNYKVKIQIVFRGREQAYKEIGYQMLEKIANEVSEIANMDNKPKAAGRNINMLLTPIKKK
jgi:translation initiation factor IF-3